MCVGLVYRDARIETLKRNASDEQVDTRIDVWTWFTVEVQSVHETISHFVPAKSLAPGKPFVVISKRPRFEIDLPDMGLPTDSATFSQLVARQGRTVFRRGRRTLIMQLDGPPSST
jgi:hypothetical protein